MIIYKRQKGQTLIETALVLFLLLLILLGITEFSRAWYAKNSLKNAARSGARVAAVTPGISPGTSVSYVYCGSPTCPFTGTPASINDIRAYVCCSPGVKPSATSVSITYTDDDSSSNLSQGDTILVSVRTNFSTVMPKMVSNWIPRQFTADVSMRYE
jgi:Flp pilus assembly protein TadG